MAFLVFEGIDGVGKSTVISLILEKMKEKGIPCVRTHEPGGTPLGEKIRDLLLHGKDIHEKTELLLYEASRSEHVESFIKKKLKEGNWVFCDRFVASSLAFQAGGRSIEEKEVSWLNEFSTGGLKPDLTVLFDLEVEKAMERIEKRGQKKDRFEKEKKTFHEAVRREYLKIAQREKQNWLVMDASLTPEKLVEIFFEQMEKRKWLESSKN